MRLRQHEGNQVPSTLGFVTHVAIRALRSQGVVRITGSQSTWVSLHHPRHEISALRVARISHTRKSRKGLFSFTKYHIVVNIFRAGSHLSHLSALLVFDSEYRMQRDLQHWSDLAGCFHHNGTEKLEPFLVM